MSGFYGDAQFDREPNWGVPINEQDAEYIEQMRRDWWRQKQARDAQRTALGVDETSERLKAIEDKLARIMARLGID